MLRPLVRVLVLISVSLVAPCVFSTDQQALENPRIVVPENLGEAPQVDVLTPEEAADRNPGDGGIQPTSDETQTDRNQLEQELDIESAEFSDQPVLDKTNRLMDVSRLPLTYIQDHVPFLTKRKIIFFGRLELDYAHYSSGILEDDSGFKIRRFRVGLAGNLHLWRGVNYKLELDLTDGDNTLSDAYLLWHSGKWGSTSRFSVKI
jgi:hypothetical protein